MKCSPGNSIFEFLLYSPLLLLFIFGAADGGLTIYQKSLITEGTKLGLSSLTLFSKETPPLYLSNDLALTIAPENLETLSKKGLAEIEKNILSTLQKLPNAKTLEYKIELTAFLLPINSETGEVLSHSSYEIVSRFVSPAGSSFSLIEKIPSFPYLSRDAFLKQKLKENPLQGILKSSGYFGTEAAEGTYFNKVLIFYAEVTALPSGFHQEFIKQTLGRYYGIQEQQFIPIRTLLR